MTTTPAVPAWESTGSGARFRLNRAGILNVWQYDDQVFDFADGRLLLRGANGAGKSKTLEMLLPFALDGDKTRITASAKHHTSLLWLMTDGFEGNARAGYIWVEFLRTDDSGKTEAFTCGVGIRASESQRTATAWHFVTPRRIGHDFSLEDASGPLSRPRLADALGADGHVFEKAAAYKEHVGRTLFGLDPAQYDEVLRLLYWLRQPQVGEDIDPGKLAQHLSHALPQLDEQAIRKAGDTFDELVAFGEQIERRAAAAAALTDLAVAYEGYARAVTAGRAAHLTETMRTERSLRGRLRTAVTTLETVLAERESAEQARTRADAAAAAADTRLRALQDSPEAREQRRLTELADRAAREQGEAERAADRVRRKNDEYTDRAAALAETSTQLIGQGREFFGNLTEAHCRQQDCVPGSVPVVPQFPVVPQLPVIELASAADADRFGAALDTAVTTIDGAQAAVGVREAAVIAVRAAVGRVEAAKAREAEAQRRADDAEARWDEARTRRVQSERAAEQAESGYREAFVDWARRPEAAPLDIPGEFTRQTLDALPELVRIAARAPLNALRAQLQAEQTRHDNAEAEIRELDRRRREIEEERDPAPPAPALGRSARPDGHALWQVVDFAAGTGERERADLEAALQASGLLDGWLRPGGQLLDAGARDTLLDGRTRAIEPTLAQVLRVDLPAGSDLTAGEVQSVLGAVHFGAADAAEAAVAADGTWRLGPARGRAGKELPQYIGATARAQERARRLAEIDRERSTQRGIRDAAETAAGLVRGEIDALEQWRDARPSDTELRDAWTRLGEHVEAQARDEQANRDAQRTAQQRRGETAAAHDELTRLAQEHELSTDDGQLDALHERLRDLRTRLQHLDAQIPRLRLDLAGWRKAAAAAADAARELAAERADAEASEDRAGQTRIELETLREAVGASVHELERAVEQTKAAKQDHDDEKRAAERRVQDLAEQVGSARTGLSDAQERLASHAPARAEALEAFAQLVEVPGLLAAAGVTSPEAYAQAGGLPADAPVPEPVLRAAREQANQSAGDLTKTADRVWAAHRDAESGPAADHQPVTSRFGDLLAVTARDDAGEAPVVVLAARVAASVEHDRALLTDREKKQFEQHILGELGDALRACRRDADELVTSMNGLLGEVTTSQGIRLRLRWALRDDIPVQARAAVELLAQPVGALLPEERAALRDALHGLIETSRAMSPELSYSEHLAASLDYRTWSEFSIRYSRPEKPGAWERLHRRSALSQGEQKVLCYLPLFAAAAAHFTSLAGAAPYAPRLVLLDDAFPKIDVKTHPLLFGLLVQLELDFVITSERLWGCHETVPSLAIYEALRDPTQRGIAQYESRWDGRTLHSIG